MTRNLLSTLCVGAAVLLSGCASDDPNEGGFIGGLIGLGSGAYGERIDTEKAALETEEERYRDEIDGREELDQIREQRSAQVENLEGQVAFLEQEMGDLDTEIDALQQREDVTREQVAKAEADVAGLLENIDQIEAEQAAHEEARALGADADQETDPAQFGEPPRENINDLRAYIEKLQGAVDALKSTRAEKSNDALTAPPVAE